MTRGRDILAVVAAQAALLHRRLRYRCGPVRLTPGSAWRLSPYLPDHIPLSFPANEAA